MSDTELLGKLVKAQHPTYKENLSRWEKNEKVFRGRGVTEYLQKFYWEDNATSVDGATHYATRQEIATFINFAARAADKIIGNLMKQAPEPEDGLSMGGLGKVRKKQDLNGNFSRAELIYYNANRKGEGFISFVLRAMRLAIGTGHRWIGVEQPMKSMNGVATVADEQQGFHPYLVQLSPISVPLWEFTADRLKLFVVKRQILRMVDEDGEFIGDKPKDSFLVYIDGEYAECGSLAGFVHWVDEKGEYIDDAKPIPLPDGRIPYRPIVYIEDEDDISMSGADGLINVSLAHMNLGSAGDNDAIEGGGRSIFVLGGNVNSHNKAAEQKKQGARFVTIEATPSGDNSMVVPDIYDMASVSASSGIELAIARKRDEAEYIAADELKRGPSTSGEARALEFLDVKAPRLAIAASQLSQVCTFLLQNCERAWKMTPQANCVWGTKFELDTDNEDWTDIADILFKLEGKSPTLVGKSIRSLLKIRGLITDDETLDKIESELSESIQQAQVEADRASRAMETGTAPDPNADPNAE